MYSRAGRSGTQSECEDQIIRVSSWLHTKMELLTVCLALITLTGSTLAFPSGSPSCSLAKPGHHVEESQTPGPELTVDPVVEGVFDIRISHTNDILGLLISVNSTQGAFVFRQEEDGTEMFHKMQDDELNCITHSNNDSKGKELVFTLFSFTEELPEVSIIVVEKFDLWWRSIL